MNEALVFAGTRVPVDPLIPHFAAGNSLEDFPTVRLTFARRVRQSVRSNATEMLL